MRVYLSGDNAIGIFAKKLLDIGNGQLPFVSPNGDVALNCGQICGTLEELEERVFPQIARNYKDLNWLSERAILAPKNVAVEKGNEAIVRKLPPEEKVYSSIDSVESDDESVSYPTEFLNSLEPSGMPPHNLI